MPERSWSTSRSQGAKPAERRRRACRCLPPFFLRSWHDLSPPRRSGDGQGRRWKHDNRKQAGRDQGGRGRGLEKVERDADLRRGHDEGKRGRLKKPSHGGLPAAEIARV